jgi:hypothetical protein
MTVLPTTLLLLGLVAFFGLIGLILILAVRTRYRRGVQKTGKRNLYRESSYRYGLMACAFVLLLGLAAIFLVLGY